MDGYADDLAVVIEALDLHDATLACQSTGAGEIGVAHHRREGDLLPGRPHGLTATHQDQVNVDLLAFLRS